MPLKARKIKRSVEKLFKRADSEWLQTTTAALGNADGIVQSDTDGLIYARLRNGETIKVFNDVAPADFDVRVLIGKKKEQPTLWRVIAVRDAYSTPQAPRVQYHHELHELDGPDETTIDRKQIPHFTVRVKDGAAFIVMVYGGVFNTTAGKTRMDSQPMDLSSYIPATGAVYVDIEADADGVLSVNEGTGFASPAIANVSYMPETTPGNRWVGTVILFEGMEELLNKHILVPMPLSTDYSGLATVYVRKFIGKTTAPTVNDDISLGYIISDVWVDETNDKSYQLFDNTDGAAVWEELTGGGGSGVIPADFSFTGIVSTLFTSNENDYAPTGHATATIFRLGPTNDFSLTGLAGGYAGRVVIIYNYTSGSNLLTLTSEDAASAAANQFSLFNNETVIIRPKEGFALIYDGTSSFWRPLTKIPPKIGTGATNAAAGNHNHSGVYAPADGWIPGTGTWSYTSADSPIFVASVPDADAALINVGNKIKLTQTTAKYFIVHAKGSPSGGFTPVTLYGGTDYTLANAAITSPFFSHEHSPLAFPMDPAKWTVVATDTSLRTQNNPTSGTWYNLGSVTIAMPIGIWRVIVSVLPSADRAAAGLLNVFVTLSTANNSESDASMTRKMSVSNTTLIEGSQMAERILGLAAKTSYFLNTKQQTSGAISNIYNDGSKQTTTIQLIDAYL